MQSAVPGGMTIVSESPTLSIVTPSLNRATQVEQMIKSVTNQDYHSGRIKDGCCTGLTIGGFVGALALVRRYGSLVVGLDVLSSGRIYILEAALQAFLRRPWFGFGLGNSPTFSIPGYTIELWRAHNFIMDLLMFSGMVGTLIQCCVYLLAAHSLRIKAISSPWAMGGFFSLIAILIDGLAEPNVFTYKVDALLWMVIGIGYALYNAHSKPLVT